MLSSADVLRDKHNAKWDLTRALPIRLAYAAASACAAVNYTVHPGALNRTNSIVYDTSLIANNLIDRTRVDYQRGALTPDAKERVNTLILS